MFKRLFLVSFDCRYSLVCEVCSVNVLSLLPCHDMYVNFFTTYIYHARHAVLVLVDMGGRDDDFRVKHICGSAIQTLLVTCTISNTPTSYSMSLYEMSLKMCLLCTLLHIEWIINAYSANSNEFLFCSWDVKSDILRNAALL